MESLQEFLVEREIAEEDIQRMIINKVDCSVILLMTDEQLKDYIPLYGDRLALRDFCRRQTGNSSKEERKNSLLNKIKSRLLLKRNTNKDANGEGVSKNLGNRSASKVTRRVELGWINSDSLVKNKQVRAKTGGGTRHLNVDKATTMATLLEEAKSIFFPNRESVRGSVDDFIIELRDFQFRPVSCLATVEDMYDRSKLRILRFYIHTQPKNDISEGKSCAAEENSSVDSLPSLDGISNNSTIHENIENTPLSFEKIEEQVETSGSPKFLEMPYDQSSSDNRDISISSDDEIHFGRSTTGNNLNGSLDSTISFHEEVSIPPLLHKLRIHRGHCLKEMIQEFRNPEILQASSIVVTMILPNGQEESGYGEGVFMDCITEFWEDFVDQCCVGNKEKVPVIRHDFQAPEWTAVARIILKGYQMLKYFPTFLSRIIIEDSLYMEQSNQNLLDHFLNFVTDSEHELFTKALEDFKKVEEDDLSDALENHNCRSIVTEKNLKDVVLEIAHKELIQEPRYIVNCWADVLKDLGSKLTRDELNAIYSDMEPSAKKVTKLLHFPESMSQVESEVANHLKRFIRELDKQNIKKFMRFCTGSDLITKDIIKIDVDFVSMEGLQRRPIGRTCGKLLQLPRSYECYTIFRNEFNNVLSSGIWSMDIV